MESGRGGLSSGVVNLFEPMNGRAAIGQLKWRGRSSSIGSRDRIMYKYDDEIIESDSRWTASRGCQALRGVAAHSDSLLLILLSFLFLHKTFQKPSAFQSNSQPRALHCQARFYAIGEMPAGSSASVVQCRTVEA